MVRGAGRIPVMREVGGGGFTWVGGSRGWGSLFLPPPRSCSALIAPGSADQSGERQNGAGMSGTAPLSSPPLFSVVPPPNPPPPRLLTRSSFSPHPNNPERERSGGGAAHGAENGESPFGEGGGEGWHRAPLSARCRPPPHGGAPIWLRRSVYLHLKSSPRTKGAFPPPTPLPISAPLIGGGWGVGVPNRPPVVRQRLERLCPKGGRGKGGHSVFCGGGKGGGKPRQCGAVQQDIGMHYGGNQGVLWGCADPPPSPVWGWVPPLGTTISPVGQKGFGTICGNVSDMGPRPH